MWQARRGTSPATRHHFRAPYLSIRVSKRVSLRVSIRPFILYRHPVSTGRRRILSVFQSDKISPLADSGRDLLLLLVVLFVPAWAGRCRGCASGGLIVGCWYLGTSRPAGRHCPSFELVGIARSPCWDGWCLGTSRPAGRHCPSFEFVGLARSACWHDRISTIEDAMGRRRGYCVHRR